MVEKSSSVAYREDQVLFIKGMFILFVKNFTFFNTGTAKSHDSDKIVDFPA